MSNTKVFLLIQAVLTFALGIFLSTHGIPTSAENIALETGEKFVESANQTADQDITSVATDFEGMFMAFGAVMSSLSVIEFILVLAWIVVKK